MKNLLSILTLLALVSCGSGGGSTGSPDNPLGESPEEIAENLCSSQREKSEWIDGACVTLCHENLEYSSDPANGCSFSVVPVNLESLCTFSVTQNTCDVEVIAMRDEFGKTRINELDQIPAYMAHAIKLPNIVFSLDIDPNIIKHRGIGEDAKGLVIRKQGHSSFSFYNSDWYKFRLYDEDNPEQVPEDPNTLSATNIDRGVGFYKRFRIPAGE